MLRLPTNTSNLGSCRGSMLGNIGRAGAPNRSWQVIVTCPPNARGVFGRKLGFVIDTSHRIKAH